MKSRLVILAAGLILSLGLLACNTAKNTGSTVEDATVASAEEVGETAEDVGSEVAEGTVSVAETTGDVAAEAAEQTEDASITAAIKTSFARDDMVDASDIDVDTENGHVTLKGTVKSQVELDRAIALAKDAAGVKSVKADLTIQG